MRKGMSDAVHYNGRERNLMRIKVLAPYGCDVSALDEKSWIEVPEGTKVADVLTVIRCSRLKAKILLISVNGERVSLNTVLHDGDVLGFFIPVSGG